MFWGKFKHIPLQIIPFITGIPMIGSLSTRTSIARFDKAIRLAEKKARFEGREDLVDTWKVPEELLG